MRYLLAFSLAITMAGCGDFHGRSVTANGHTLYYVDPVSEAEATKVLTWLDQVNHNFGEPAQPFQLSKSGKLYIFRYPVDNSSDEDLKSNEPYLNTFRQKMSEEPLAGAPLEVIVVDKNMKPVKSIKAP